VAALDGAVPFEKVDQVAMHVAEDLDFDVLRILQVTLQENRRVAEGSLGLAAGSHDPLKELLLGAGHPHPPSASTGRRLDDDGVAVVLGEDEGLFLMLNGLLGARNGGDAGSHGNFSGRHLVAQGPLHFGRWSDEGDSRPFALFGELRVLRKETVAGMDGVHVMVLGNGNNFVDAEVGVDGALPLPHLVGLISLVAVERQLVLLRIDGHRADAELRAGTENADRNLTTVGSHYLPELSLLHPVLPRGFYVK